MDYKEFAQVDDSSLYGVQSRGDDDWIQKSPAGSVEGDCREYNLARMESNGRVVARADCENM